MRFTTNIPDMSREEAEQILLSERELLAIDIETVNLDNQTPIGIGIAVDSTTAFYFFNPEDELLKEAVSNSEVILTHNGSFDIPELRRRGFSISRFEDTMLLAYAAGCLEKGLESVSEQVLHRPNPKITSIWNSSVYNRRRKAAEQANIGVNHKSIARLCMTHAMNTYAIWEKLPKTSLYSEIDRPFVDLVIEMEKNGITINQYMLTEVEQEVIEVIERLENYLFSELGTEINLASNPQIVEAFQERGIIGTRKTRSGGDSVSDESLTPLNHPIANALLDWRSEVKTITTYIPQFRSCDSSGRIHTSYGYTRTGRLNSSKPNLQNITRTEKEWKTKIPEHQLGLRDCMIAAPGNVLLSLDASQIELRCAAYLSDDPLLIQACNSADLHMTTAIQVLGWVDDEDEMKVRRYKAKQINFAILYGADAYKISQMTGLSQIEAQLLLDQYFETYSVLKAWMDRMLEEAKENGFVTNLFGRIRLIPDLDSPIRNVREAAEREVVNTIVQGTAVDIVKKMMLYLRERYSSDIALVLQVHDEMVWELPEYMVEDAIDIAGELTLAFPDYPVKITTGTVYGRLD